MIGKKNNKGFCDLGFARLDIDRKRRRGFPEVIYSPGKDRRHLKKIVRTLYSSGQEILLTRLDKATSSYLKKAFPQLKYSPLAKLGYFTRERIIPKGSALVISAGTSDMPVAEEAAVTLEVMGNRVKRLYDVGVAGVHRLMYNIALLRAAKVIVVVAGMEGALASLVAGLVSCPVVAVPTSCGYGANFS
ncbi:MAG: nickel pincer cofactor biosynthesis protein LarB, partial [Candidatus Omnitrophota bacterium]|nr:nickel pincer cofactor biosynthesis protein LarB [Candidatus Omnitrophota bacterium]